MSNIKVIKTDRDEWSEKVIENLEHALEHARENPQESVIIVMVGRADSIDTFWCAESRIKLLGALEYAKQKTSDN